MRARRNSKAVMGNPHIFNRMRSESMAISPPRVAPDKPGPLSGF
jgi:hypothetical protein